MQKNENDRIDQSENYVGSWILRNILESNLSDSEKLLLGQIHNLDNGGCSATNGYLAIRLGWSLRKVERTISDLRNSGYISTSHGMKRFIYISNKTIDLINGVPVGNDGPVRFDESTKMSGRPVNNDGLPSSKMVVTPVINDDHIIKDNKDYSKEKVNKREFEKVEEVEVLDVDLVLSNSQPTKNKKRGRAARAKIIIDSQFESCWTMYERYGSKKKALTYWQKLNQDERDAIEATIPVYVESTPGCEYRKQFEGWINPENRLWERPIKRHVGQVEKARQMNRQIITDLANGKNPIDDVRAQEAALNKILGI